ncbi:hypothetical protein PKHYL_16340 [Psychrobacter sp. KH172YL61]|nr:hypothetical protein PKHYL_16340 [Psychrobacter sp. KH172YL61]
MAFSDRLEVDAMLISNLTSFRVGGNVKTAIVLLSAVIVVFETSSSFRKSKIKSSFLFLSMTLVVNLSKSSKTGFG